MLEAVLETKAHYTVLETIEMLGDHTAARFEDENKPYIVVPSDLHKMVGMGLGAIPIDALGVPAESKILKSHELALQNEVDFSRQLTSYFPGNLVAALYELQSLFKRHNLKAYVVGGNIRDLLLYRSKAHQVKDVDITIEGNAIEASQFIVANSRNFEVTECFPEFGTTKLLYKGKIDFDLASTRKEVYENCSALPTVKERGVPLITDIVRRDFTVNALAMSINDIGHIVDFTNGIVDIEQRLIRVLHPVSFFEDPSRILRAFKFMARLDFKITDTTARLAQKFMTYGHQVYNGGGERVKHELIRFLITEESPAKHVWLDRFVDYDGIRLTNMALPYNLHTETEKNEQKALLQSVSKYQHLINDSLADDAHNKNFIWQLYLCFLMEDLDDDTLLETAKQLGLKKSEREVIEKFKALTTSDNLSTITEDADPITIYQALDHQPLASITAAALKQYRSDKETLTKLLQATRHFKDKLTKIRPELNGNDLINLGLQEGEAIGKMLKDILCAKLNGRLPDRLAEVRFVEKKLGINIQPVAAEKPKIDKPKLKLINPTEGNLS